jgi:hypothetical protein
VGNRLPRATAGDAAGNLDSLANVLTALASALRDPANTYARAFSGRVARETRLALRVFGPLLAKASRRDGAEVDAAADDVDSGTPADL